MLIAVKRTVKKDATISFGGNLYGTETVLAGERPNVKYDPDAGAGINELYLYHGDDPVGVARLVSFEDNAKRRRAGGARPSGKLSAPQSEDTERPENRKTNTISYSDAMGGGSPCSRNTSA